MQVPASPQARVAKFPDLLLLALEVRSTLVSVCSILPSFIIDFVRITAKLGILPKKPVSLMGSRPQGASSPTSPRRDPEDDDLEYMENPFEEERK